MKCRQMKLFVWVYSMSVLINQKNKKNFIRIWQNKYKASFLDIFSILILKKKKKENLKNQWWLFTRGRKRSLNEGQSQIYPLTKESLMNNGLKYFHLFHYRKYSFASIVGGLSGLTSFTLLYLIFCYTYRKHTNIYYFINYF